uniref:Major facilitator superfamily (MFS) profile domain-containing protein n=2 Tax=Emiliania huxleyi TaxID=2903 RepID=A0A7S3RR26_EMIHU
MGGVVFGVSALFPALYAQNYKSSACSARCSASAATSAAAVGSWPATTKRRLAEAGEFLSGSRGTLLEVAASAVLRGRSLREGSFFDRLFDRLSGKAEHSKAEHSPGESKPESRNRHDAPHRRELPPPQPHAHSCSDPCPLGVETKCCDHQFVAFSLAASLAFFLVDAAAAPWGELADRRGGKLTLAWASLLSIAGFAALAGGAYLLDDAIVTAGLLALGCAGPGVFNGAFYGTLELIGTGEPKIRAALTSLNAAAFDGSALVFMLLRVAARAARVGLAAPCLAWAALCAPLCVALWRLLPAHGSLLAQPAAAASEQVGMLQAAVEGESKSEVGEDAGDESETKSDVASPLSARWKREEEAARLRKLAVEVSGGEVGMGAVLLSASNCLLVLYMAVYHLVSNFYLETQIDQLEELFGAGHAEWLSSAFNFAFPLGGLLASVPVASLLERAGEAEYFGIATLLANTFSLCSLSSSRQPQLAAALLFGPVRCLTWACYFQFLSTESRYPPGLSARAMGYNNVVIAIVGAAGPYTLAYLVNERALLGGASMGMGKGRGDSRYLQAKLFLQLCNTLIAIFPCLLWRERRRKQAGAAHSG